MNLHECLTRAAASGDLNETHVRDALARFDDLTARYAADGTPEGAARRLAADDLLEAASQNAQRTRHTMLAQLRDMARAQRDYAPGIAHRDPDRLLTELDQVDRARSALEQRLLARMDGFLEHNRTRVTGRLRDKAMVEDVARELHGQSTGNAAAREMADAVEGTQEYARQLFNMAGGDIGRLEHRGVRHAHDGRKVEQAGFDTWFAALWDGRMIDWSRIRNFDTGRAFAAEPGAQPPRATAEAFLREVYETVTTGGWNTREPSVQPGGAATWRRRSEHRVLHFTDGDAWLRYNEQFGQANPFDAIIGEIKGMARDISMMQAFGPNPRAGVEFRSQLMARDAATAPPGARAFNIVGTAPLRDVIERKNKKARVMLAHISGAANVPADGMAAGFFAGTRNLLTAAQLGSAPLVQVSDMATTRLAAKAAGLNPTAPWQSAMALMTSRVTQQEARDMGFIFDTWANAGSAQARFTRDLWSPEWTSRVTNFVLRSNGLAYLTDRSRTAMRYTFATELGGMAGRGFDELDARLQTFLQNRGIGAADWDHLRAPGAMYRLPTGGQAISPRWFAEHTDLPRPQAEDLARRLGAVIEEFTELGVPTNSLRGRATILGDTRPGSVPGEVMRSFGMYKSFSLSLMFNHMNRVAEMRDLGTQATYVAAIVAQMTVLGVVAVQLKEIARGRDPRPLDAPETWGAGFFQGGGVGILGDFITSTTSRAGGGLAETVAGPMVGLAADLDRAVNSNAARMMAGDDPLLGRDVTNLARRYNPLATHWVVRTAMDRMIWDQVQDILDPDARDQWRDWERRARDAGTQSFWRRGQMTPDRAPDLTNMMRAQ